MKLYLMNLKKLKVILLYNLLICFCCNNLFCQNEIIIQQKSDGTMMMSSYLVVKKSFKKLPLKTSTIQLIHIDSLTLKDNPLSDVLKLYISQSVLDGLDYFCLYNMSDSVTISANNLIAYEMAKDENGSAKPIDIMFKQICSVGNVSMNLNPYDYLIFVDKNANKGGSFKTDVKLFLATSNGIVSSNIFKKNINPHCFFFNTEVIKKAIKEITVEFIERKIYLPEKKVRLQ